MNFNSLLKYRKELLKYIAKLSNNYDDIVQDTYLKLFIYFKNDKLAENNIKSLLFMTARNLVYDEYRKNKQMQFCKLSNDILQDEPVELREIVLRGNETNINILKDQCRGMCIKDLALKYDLSVSTVKCRLFYIKQKLREINEKKYDQS